MTKPFVSIIIPHFMTLELLEQCLSTIPQSPDFEVIVVDDHSPIERRQLEKIVRPHTLLVLEENHGAGYARNRAISLASGQYLLFADADDYFTPELKLLPQRYRTTTADIVFFNYRSESLEKDQKVPPTYRCSRFERYKHSGDMLENYLRYAFGPPWAKLVKRSFVKDHQVCFDEVFKHNDTMFSLRIGVQAEEVVVDDTPLYVNTYHKNSMTTQKEMDYKKWVEAVWGVEWRYHNLTKKMRIKAVKWRFMHTFELMLREHPKALGPFLQFLKAHHLRGYFYAHLLPYVFYRFWVIASRKAVFY